MVGFSFVPTTQRRSLVDSPKLLDVGQKLQVELEGSRNCLGASPALILTSLRTQVVPKLWGELGNRSSMAIH